MLADLEYGTYLCRWQYPCCSMESKDPHSLSSLPCSLLIGFFQSYQCHALCELIIFCKKYLLLDSNSDCSICRRTLPFELAGPGRTTFYWRSKLWSSIFPLSWPALAFYILCVFTFCGAIVFYADPAILILLSWNVAFFTSWPTFVSVVLHSGFALGRGYFMLIPQF